mmetsp:Transcript_11035/g.14361  ORF Transcript_11035/g.14361 Transcript_11035/m.14361 type:complete len:294 (-) Transcript_11035:139-1020(-)
MFSVRKLTETDIAGALRFFGGRHDAFFAHSNILEKGLKDTGAVFCATYLGLFYKEKQIKAIAAHCWNGNLLISAENVETNQLLELARSTLRESPEGRTLNGFLGTEWAVKELLNVFPATADQPASISYNKMYYCDRDSFNKIESGSSIARLADGKDLDTVSDWRVKFMKDSVGLSVSDKECRLRMETDIERKSLHVLERISDGHMVAMASTTSRVGAKFMIGNVYTSHPFRGKGYAKKLISSVVEDLICGKTAQYNTALLFTDIPAAIKVYKAVGFRECGNYMMVLYQEPVIL